MGKYSIMLLAVLTVACGGRGTRTTAAVKSVPAKRYSYVIRNEFPHLTTSYTQGLQYVDGVMWEGTGQYGESRLQTIDLQSGRASVIHSLPRNEFGEGITVLGNRIFYLTWQNGFVHVYDRNTYGEITTIRYQGEGWGLTTDGARLFMSDGTDCIRVIDPETFGTTSSINVTFEGKPLFYLNELEWIDGRIWANVYTSSYIAIINPGTGIVEGLVNLTGILPEESYGPDTDVLNGIAYDAATKRIFVTGKNWNRLYEIELVEL